MVDMVKLKTGEELPVTVVAAIMSSLNTLMDGDVKDLVSFGELVAVCRNPKHQLSDEYRAYLASRGLIEDNGQPNETTRQVVRAAVEGEGLDILLGSPVATS